MPFDPAKLLSDLTLEEGFRREPYDDAQPSVVLKSGVALKGTVTFGHGLTWITEDESRAILQGRIGIIANALGAVLPWFSGLSEARQRALIDMSYNLGLTGLQGFTVFLDLMREGKFDEAADDLKTTKWAGQVGNRAKRIEALIRGDDALIS
jgi:lysozyme